MEIRVYDEEFNLKRIVENHSSLLWRRRYNDGGDFSVTCPATTENVKAFSMGNIVWVRDKVEAGIVENRSLSSDNTLVVSGRFLDAWMDRRLIRPTYNFSGRTEVAMRTILSNAASLPMVQLDTLQDFTEEVEFQASYKNLLEYEKKLAKSAGFGYRFEPDFVNKTVTFKIYKGLDHTKSQNDRPRVIFSDEFMNMSRVEVDENDQLYKTVVYVGGEGEWSTKYVIVSGDDTLTGLARREVYSDGSDLTSNGLSTNQYKQKLAQRGVEILEGCVDAKSVTCQINPVGNFTYGTHYDVGDIVTIEKSEWNVSEDLRITEVQEIYEHGLPSIEVTFGTTLPETISWED